jgi:hypothetical protein
MDDARRLRIVGGEADAKSARLDPEVAEFVRWFTDWWLARGVELVAKEEEAERRRAA